METKDKTSPTVLDLFKDTMPSDDIEILHTMPSDLPPMMPPRPNHIRPPSGGNLNGDGSSLTRAEERTCRICLQDDADEDYDNQKDPMIAPCRCRGTSKWVHRSCLDRWRVHQHSRAFSNCTECGFEYRMQVPHHLRKGVKRHWNRCKFYAFVSRDVLLATFLLQAFIGLLAWMAYALDPERTLVSYVNDDCLVDADTVSFWCNYTLSLYYLCGLLLLLILLGLVGSMILCCTGCSFESSLLLLLSPMSYDNNRQGQDNPSCCQVCCDCRGCNCGDCRGCNDCCNCVGRGCCDCCRNCGDCNCNCDGDGAMVLLVLLIIFAVVLATIGLIMGVILTVIFCQRVVQRHIFLLQKKQLVGEFIVMDLSGYDVTDPDALEAATQNQGVIPLPVFVPSAPDESEMPSTPDLKKGKAPSSSSSPDKKKRSKMTSLTEEDRLHLRNLGLY